MSPSKTELVTCAKQIQTDISPNEKQDRPKATKTR